MEIHESLDRILNSDETVADLFYGELFERRPELRPFFQAVNLRHQAVLLTMALAVIAQHYGQPFPVTTRYLRVLGHRHHARGIPADRYPGFGQVLLENLARFHGPDWTPELARQWSEAIDQATQTMLEGYREPFAI